MKPSKFRVPKGLTFEEQVQAVLGWVDKIHADRRREYETAMIADDVDPDVIQEVTSMGDAVYAAKREEIEASIRQMKRDWEH